MGLILQLVVIFR